MKLIITNAIVFVVDVVVAVAATRVVGVNCCLLLYVSVRYVFTSARLSQTAIVIFRYLFSFFHTVGWHHLQGLAHIKLFSEFVCVCACICV